MSNICLLKSHSRWSYKSLHFWRLSGKVFRNKCCFVNDSFPWFFASFSGLNNRVHFCLCHGLYFCYRNAPFSSLFFSLLFDHIWEYFICSLLLSFHKIMWHWIVIIFLALYLDLFFLMTFDFFMKLNFFLVSLLVKNLTLYSSEFSCLFGDHLMSSAFAFSSFYITVFLNSQVVFR